MRRTKVVVACLATFTALAATAFAAGPAESIAATSVAGPADPRIDYVALGDSYSAGPLVPPPPGRSGMRDDPASCARSWNNYPAFLATYLKVASYTDVTCSGAEVADFFTPQGETPYAAPQIDALSEDTDLVTVGIGGNDYGLFGSIIDTCTELAEQYPTWKAPCQRHFTIDGVDTKARDAKLIRARIVRAVHGVREAAPNADVYVLGYPRLLPPEGTCDAIVLGKGDVAWADHIERLLNRSVRRGAEAEGATYVDLYPATRGHDACAGTDAYVNGPNLILGGPRAAAPFHPFRTGERAMARATYELITGKPASGRANANPARDAIVLNPPYAPEL